MPLPVAMPYQGTRNPSPGPTTIVVALAVAISAFCLLRSYGNAGPLPFEEPTRRPRGRGLSACIHSTGVYLEPGREPLTTCLGTCVGVVRGELIMPRQAFPGYLR
jgi:hypothetical protein